MKHIFICLLIFFSAVCVFAEEVTFTYVPPALDSVRQLEKNSTVSMEMVMNNPSTGQTMNLNLGNSGQYKISEKVLAVTDGVVTGLKVEYLEALKTELKQGKTTTVEEPVKGHTYLVTMSDDAPKITDLRGQLLPAAEQMIVSKDYKREENKDLIEKLNGKKLIVGKRVTFMEDAIKSSFEEKFQGGSLSDIVVIFRETRMQDGVRCGVFSVKFFLSANINTASMSVNFTGEVIIAIDKAWVMEMSMAGPIIIASAAPEDDTAPDSSSLSGSGKMAIAVRYNYNNR